MAIDPATFELENVADTCAIWNVLSSGTLFAASQAASCQFSCTAYVIYECLVKSRKVQSVADQTLKRRLIRERARGQFVEHHIDLDELVEVAAFEGARKLGRGELSSIALSRKHRRAVLTDDQKARRFAAEVCGDRMVQTTPHLLGWLFYSGHLLDGDLTDIVLQHEEAGRPLGRYFQKVYTLALEYRARDRQRNCID